MPKRKPLSDYLEQIKSASDKQEKMKAKRLGEIALKKLPVLSYTPHEEYQLYRLLALVYYSLEKYSHSLELCHKAYLIALKKAFSVLDVACVFSLMGSNLVFIGNIPQALKRLQTARQYYDSTINALRANDKTTYCYMLIDLAYCYLHQNEIKKGEEIIENKLPAYLPCLPNNLGVIDYTHFKGEYFIIIKKYEQAKQCFTECVKMSNQIDFPRGRLCAEIHLATISLLESQIEPAIRRLKNIIKDAGCLRLNAIVCEASLLLSKCYNICGFPDKGRIIENRIKPILSKLDTVWLYEKTREFDRLYQQLQDKTKHKSKLIPQVLVQTLSDRYEKSADKYTLIGNSPIMQEVYQIIEKIAPTDLPVLIQGETGTGKELIANAIHTNSQRVNKAYLPFNCVVLPETLIESHLFGHTKGAFTGAHEDKKGYIELASGGTLFIDEIANMSLSMQQKLLRVLEEKLIYRVGASKSTPVDTRFVFASNQDVEQMVKNKFFREDLFYRINTIVVNLPPLRDRKDDIPLLVQHFLQKYGRPSPLISHLSPSVLALLSAYPWPGNVRELESEIRRICVLYPDTKTITEKMLSENIRCYIPVSVFSASKNSYLKNAVESLERNIINASIQQYNGNITYIAQHLGCTRAVLHKKIKRLKIDL